MYTSTVQSGPPSANAALPPHLRLLTFYLPSAHFVSSPSAPSLPSLAPGCPSTPLLPLPSDSLRVLQWNAGGLRARSTELLHFLRPISLTLSVSRNPILTHLTLFRIPEFSALQSDRSHCRSGILVLPRTLAAVSSFSSGRAYPFLNFLPTLSLRLTPTLIPPLSFLNVYASHLLFSNGWQNRLLFSLHSFLQKSFHSGWDINYHHPLWDSKGTSVPRGEKVCDWVISSDLLPQ